MSGTVLSCFEMAVILSTAAMLGIVIYQMKKRYREARTVLSCIAAAFGFAVCVVMSGLEKDRMTESPAVWGAAVLFEIAAIALLVTTDPKKDVRPGRDAVIEAFDKTDIAVCYYDSFGRVVLCSESMHKISVSAFGIRVLNGSEFMEDLRSVWNGTDLKNTYEFRTGNKWYSVRTGAVTVEGELLTELIAADITDLKEKKEQLERNNGRLAEMNRRLSEYGGIADTVIREQEILNAKIRIHDRFGDLLITAKRAVMENVPDGELDRIAAYMRNTLSYMKPEEEPPREDDYEELTKAADGIGVTIHMTGTLPETKPAREIVLLGIRECLTNTVKHAGGHHLFVAITNGDKTRVKITNDGEKPKGDVTPGTGLSSLKMKAEKAGGSVRVLNENGFMLIMEI